MDPMDLNRHWVDAPARGGGGLRILVLFASSPLVGDDYMTTADENRGCWCSTGCRLGR